MIFDPNDAVGARALERLASDMIGWLTTVTPAGQPQTMPIWFAWIDGELLVYGDHRAKRNANIAANPKVSFHLNDNGRGGDVVIVQGTARIDPDYPQVGDNPAYLAKYGEWIDKYLEGPAAMGQVYNMPILVTPTRGIAFPG
ncbi:MAG TPA: TIGR03667 family PPOX class F420-dependent oxidoreductase [Candidatus Limnocylindrales bacterium]|nr:TIGR03667 family PPOX class F420-dependent oxidoreductase [Candidatus Limnocylindrales bacterium]